MNYTNAAAESILCWLTELESCATLERARRTPNACVRVSAHESPFLFAIRFHSFLTVEASIHPSLRTETETHPIHCRRMRSVHAAANTHLYVYALRRYVPTNAKFTSKSITINRKQNQMEWQMQKKRERKWTNEAIGIGEECGREKIVLAELLGLRECLCLCALSRYWFWWKCIGRCLGFYRVSILLPLVNSQR